MDLWNFVSISSIFTKYDVTYLKLHRFLEALMFLIGSAYFVAGSYPEGYRAIHGGEDGIDLEGGESKKQVEVYNPVVVQNHYPGNNIPPPIASVNSHDYTYDKDDMETISYKKPKEPVLWKPRGREALPTQDYDEVTM